MFNLFNFSYNLTKARPTTAGMFVKNCCSLKLGTSWTKTKISASGKYAIKKQLTLYHMRIRDY